MGEDGGTGGVWEEGVGGIWMGGEWAGERVSWEGEQIARWRWEGDEWGEGIEDEDS